MTEQWIVIPNWDDFQHYKKRDAPWIKTYTRLLRKPEYLSLTLHQRGLLHGLWITYALNEGKVPLRLDLVRTYLGHSVKMRDLEALNQAGFIEFSASKPLAQRQRQRHTPISPNNNGPKTVTKVKGGPCPDCGETIGKGHLETCPRMPRTVDYLEAVA